MTPSESIRQAFLQFTFAIKLMAFVKGDKMPKADFDIGIEAGGARFDPDTFHTDKDLIYGVENNYMITFGFTALALDSALSNAGFRHDLPINSTDRDLRALVYMIRCAFAHDMIHPAWESRGPFARKLSVPLPSGTLIVDTADLNGKPFSDSDVGGIKSYLEIKTEVERMLGSPVK